MAAGQSDSDREDAGPIPAEWFYAIKGATRDLTDRAGTLDRAARICGRSITRLNAYRDNNKPDIIPAVAAIALQRETGATDYTDIIARLSARGGPSGGGADFVESQIGLGQAALDAYDTINRAAADGVISPSEKQQIAQKVSALQDRGDAVHDSINSSGADPIILFKRRSAS